MTDPCPHGGLCDDCTCAPQPTVPAPSDEASWTIYICGTSGSPYTCSCDDGDYDTECVGEYAVQVVPAALLAKARAEGEAARTAEIVAWLRSGEDVNLIIGTAVANLLEIRSKEKR